MHSTTARVIALLFVIGALLATLKVSSVVAWPWWLVTLPWWIGFALVLVVLLVFCVGAVLSAWARPQ